MSGSETGISSCHYLKIWRGSSTLELVCMKLQTIISFTSKIHLPSQHMIFPEQSICKQTLQQIFVLVEPNALSVSSWKPTNVPHLHPAEIIKTYFCNNHHNITFLFLSQSSQWFHYMKTYKRHILFLPSVSTQSPSNISWWKTQPVTLPAMSCNLHPVITFQNIQERTVRSSQ